MHIIKKIITKKKFSKIKDYINKNEVSNLVNNVKHFGTRKSSCNALIHYYTLLLTYISNSYKILK